MKCKGEWFERFKEFQAFVETQSEYKIKAFRWMSGGDFISKDFEAFFMEHGIESTPQHIGPAGCAISKHCCNGKAYARSSKAREIALGGSGGKCGLHTKPMSYEGLDVRYTRRNVEWEAALRCTHACVWKPCICDGSGGEEGKFNAKRTKCMFLGYCEGMEAYRLMCLETKKIIKSRDVVFMEDSGSISNDLEMRPSGRNGGRTVVVVDESSKSPLFDGGEQTVDDKERVGGNGVAIEESCEKSANNDIFVESLDEERRYPTRERRPLGEWWKNHILPQRGEERANVAIVEDPLSWNEAIRVNMRKLMSNVRSSLYRMEKLRKSRVLQIFDYSQSGSVGSGALGCS